MARNMYTIHSVTLRWKVDSKVVFFRRRGESKVVFLRQFLFVYSSDWVLLLYIPYIMTIILSAAFNFC